jgi:hypothetical protein
MERAVEALARGAPVETAHAVYEPVAAPDITCRVCELETENARLRLLVGELLVANQRLRDSPSRRSASRGAPAGRDPADS